MKRGLLAASLLLWAACATTNSTTTTEPTTTEPPPLAPPKKAKPSRELSAEATRATLQAELLLQDGDVEGAVNELRAAVGHDPTSSYLRLRLGEALLLFGDANGADDAAEDAVRLADGKDKADKDAVDQRVAALRLKAVTREQLGDDDGSIIALRRALEARPDRQASAMLAERLVKKGELSLAEDVVEKWMTAEADAGVVSVDGYVALARVYAERDEVDRAIAHLERALSLQPDDGDALLLKRDLFSALGRYDDAAVIAQDYARARGDGPDVRGLLLTSIALKDPAEARVIANAWLDDDGGDQNRLLVADAFEGAGLFVDASNALANASTPRALLSLEHARLALHLRQPKEAARLACPSASRAGGLEERLQDYAVSLCARAEADRGDADAGLARLLMAAQDRPKSARLLDGLKNVAKTASLSRKAALRQHIEANVKGGVSDKDADPDVTVAAAFALDAVDEPAAAKALLSKALTKKPQDPTLGFAFARLLVDQAGAGNDADIDGGVELVERLVERTGPDVDTLNFMAFTVADRALEAKTVVDDPKASRPPPRVREARGWAWQAVLRAPLNGYVLDTLGWALVSNGDVDGAIAVLRRADRLSPDEGEIWFHLATALALKKDPTAKEAAQKARSLLSPTDPLLARLALLERSLDGGAKP